MNDHRQFCPVARSAHLLCWPAIPLLLRELLNGSTHVGDIRAGVPTMRESELHGWLRALEEGGVVRRETSETADGVGDQYFLTRAGWELRPVVETLGVWGRRWLGDELQDIELDVDLLMRDVRKRVDRARAPQGRTVVAFRFDDQVPPTRHRWLVLEPDEHVSVRRRAPSGEPDLRVAGSLAALTAIWLGDRSTETMAAEGAVEILGRDTRRRDLPRWLGRNAYATVEPARPCR